ncbi:hypothetical protein OYC64_021163 [Pagothenia borchgrevinki]|uniref:Ribosomal RNA-processing protein 14/surfeit locus protein 6 C-terminal domain-containing protein n=1 Tax=Pagothenia borchgrevinki TaxID=8213 RepID=A0ABD2FZU4_PAGBO
MRRSLISNPNKSPLLQRLLRKAPAASKRNVTAIVFNKVETVENKMKWTNVLYKAEGLKIKDDEDTLRSSLKKEWGDQNESIVEKQKRQEEMEEHPTSVKLEKELLMHISDIFTTILIFSTDRLKGH